MTPTAAQLEVVRRLRSDGALAELVLTTPVGGRGWVDPTSDEVPDRELLRVCVAAIARWCEGEPTTAPAPEPARARRWRPRLSYLVAGTSPQALAVRSALVAAGHPGGALRRPTVLVVGGSLDGMVAGDWRRRVDAGSGVRWRRVWSVMQARDHLPLGTDLAAQAQRHTDVWGPDRVHVVLADDPALAVTRAAGILGVRLGQAPLPPAHPVDTDLLRLVNQLLAAKGSRARRPSLRRPWPGGFGAPAAQLDWAVARGSALAGELRDGPWQVHGDPAVVVPSTDAALARAVAPNQTLTLALEVLGRLEGGEPWPGR